MLPMSIKGTMSTAIKTTTKVTAPTSYSEISITQMKSYSHYPSSLTQTSLVDLTATFDTFRGLNLVRNYVHPDL
jgi:hypothetical protein